MCAKIQNASIGDAIFATITWPDNPDLQALLSGLLEVNRDLGLALDEEINHLVSLTATAAWHAGFKCGQNPVKLLFSEQSVID